MMHLVEPEPLEFERAQTARLLDALLRLCLSLERENALLRISIDMRLGVLEGSIIRQRDTGRHVQDADCPQCGQLFTRRHPKKKLCDACQREVYRARDRARYQKARTRAEVA